MSDEIGRRATKTSGDYTFEGEVRAVFTKKRGGAVRYVIEDDRGVCLIMNRGQFVLDPLPDASIT